MCLPERDSLQSDVEKMVRTYAFKTWTLFILDNADLHEVQEQNLQSDLVIFILAYTYSSLTKSALPFYQERKSPTQNLWSSNLTTIIPPDE